LHRFDERDVLTVANARACCNGEAANASGHFGDDSDIWHTNPLCVVRPDCLRYRVPQVEFYSALRNRWATMGRRSERLSRQGMLAGDSAGEGGDVIQVVSRAFDVLRCFEGHDARLGNLEISNRCGLPRSTVSRLTHTLTRMGQLVYLPRDQKYRIGPSAV